VSDIVRHGTEDPWQPGMPRRDPMSALLARHWWAIAIRAVAAILFGLICLALPFHALRVLILFFAAYMLVDGVFAIVAGVQAAARHERWGLLLLEGVVDIAAGLVAFFLPGVTVFVMVAVLGIWAVVSGVTMAVAAFQLHATHGKWWLVAGGAISVIWGVLLFLWPIGGALVLTIWLGAYALIFGIALLILAFRLRARRQARIV